MRELALIQKITVIGAGSWGTALALHLARKGYEICLWSARVDQVQSMQTSRYNERYLPGIILPDNLNCTTDLAVALSFSYLVLVVVPSHAFRAVLQQFKPYWTLQHALVWATKGIDPGSNGLLHAVVSEVLSAVAITAVLSGPNFAREIAQGLPAATTLACKDERVRVLLAHIFKSGTLRVYGTRDIIGVEIAGTVKNVIAIAVGICDGLQLGANARAALITRGLAEITRLGLAMGAEAETFVSMAGIGDLLLTCTDNQSRNRRFGLLVSQSNNLDEIFSNIGQVVEGYHNVQQVLYLAKQFAVAMPITEQVYAICYQQLDPTDCARVLMQR